MSKFTTRLSITLKENSSKVWIVTFPLVYESDLIGKVIVPVGFETDLASVPRIPIIYSLWGGRVHTEAVIHDYLFRSNSIPRTTFSVDNEVFLEAMTVRAKPWYIRFPMYWGVCLLSKGFYHKRKVEDLI